MSNIVILQGSPRADGNTSRLVAAFRQGLSPEHEVTEIQVSELNVKGCRGCNTCYSREGNKCFQHDDMETVLPAMKDADVLVFASPVYFYGISSQLKTFIDRLHAPFRNRFKVKRVALMLVCAGSMPEVFDAILTQYRLLLNFFHLEDLGKVLVRGVREPGDIEGRPELESATALGRAIK